MNTYQIRMEVTGYRIITKIVKTKDILYIINQMLAHLNSNISELNSLKIKKLKAREIRHLSIFIDPE